MQTHDKPVICGQEKKKEKKRKERTNDPDVATSVNCGVASFLSWSSAHSRIRGPFEGEHIERTGADKPAGTCLVENILFPRIRL